MIDISHKARIQWSCRRGMRELDILLMPFFTRHYDSLSDEDKRGFIRLLACDDPDLFNWLMAHGRPDDAQLQHLVQLIQQQNQQRDQ